MEDNKLLKKKKLKKRIIIISSVVLTVSIILYALAYRYLIDRVETPIALNASTTTASTASTTTASSSSAETGNVVSDDWNYKSDNVQISVKQVVKGSGADKITYYVADVKVTDVSYLSSAFAQDTFGRNIVETTSDIAENNGAVFAINGDYYGYRENGILIRNGSIYRDTAARMGAALYSDGSMKTYNESDTSATELINSGVIDTFSFGPILVQNGIAITDFENVSIDNNIKGRSIQDANPRTGIGMIEPNHYVFIVVDGRSTNYSRGMTLSEFAQTFADLGCTEAYNLDGGGSSTMYFNGRVVNNPLGKGEEREISDILYIKG